LVAGLEQHALTKKTASNRGRQYRLLADADLITLVEDDDPEAFATLYERHGRAAYSVAYRMAGERQGAEDLVQEAFLEAWRAAGSYRAEKGSVKTWVLSIVRNRGIDLLRSSASRHRIQHRVQAAALTSQPGGAFVETWHDSQRERIREALSHLPPDQLEVLELAYFSGYTHAEIAEVLSLPLGTVKGRVRLSLKKVKERLSERDDAGERGTRHEEVVLG
jgi:RNA polymerase sigma-70 factor (ECF subfamily)